MAGNYQGIKITDKAPIGTYLPTTLYNTAGDNQPFPSIEDSYKVVADLQKAVGTVWMAHTTDANVANWILGTDTYDTTFRGSYKIGAIQANTGELLVDAATIAPNQLLDVTYLPVLLFPVDMNGSILAYGTVSSTTADAYFYSLVQSDAISIPKNRDFHHEIFATTSWNAGASWSAGSRLKPEVGDYLYLCSTTDDENNPRLGFAPLPKNVPPSACTPSFLVSNKRTINIASITPGTTTTITTSVDHDLMSDAVVTFSGITGSVGDVLNGNSYTITVTDSTTFTVNANTSGKTYTSGGVAVLALDSIKIGRVLAETTSDYIIAFGTYDQFGTLLGATDVTHQALSDIAAESSTDVNTWVLGHFGFTLRTVVIPSSIPLTATKGQLIEVIPGTVPTYQVSAKTPGATLLGVYIMNDASGNHWLATKGEWDPSTNGFNQYIAGLNANTPADIGLQVWDDGAATAGNATTTLPTYSGTSTSPIRRLGYVTNVTGTNAHVYIDIQNGINAALDTALTILQNSTSAVPDNTSVRQLNTYWDSVGKGAAGWTELTPTDATCSVPFLAKINPDYPIHIAPLYKDTVSNEMWFALSESSYINDLLEDLGSIFTSTALYTAYMYHLDNFQLNQYADPYVDPNPFSDSAQWYTGPGIGGGFRAGERQWVSCQNQGTHDGLNLTAITYDSTAATITLTSDSAIRLWSDVIQDELLGYRPQIPEVGVMVLIHDVLDGKACLFSYEGYEYNDTSYTFTFKNVVIHTGGNWLSDPSFSTVSDAWRIRPMFVGGLRLTIDGTGTFNQFAVTPPVPSTAWNQYKKSGICDLGATLSASNTDGRIEGGGVRGWDKVDDAAGGTRDFWTHTVQATNFRTLYPFDYVPANDYDVLTYSELSTGSVVGCISRAYPHAGNVIADMAGTSAPSSAGTNKLTLVNDVNPTFHRYSLTLNTTGGDTDPASSIIAEGKGSSIRGTRLNLRYTGSDANTYSYAGLFIEQAVASGGTSLLYFVSGVSLAGTGTITNVSWELYTTNDDITNLPSLLVMNSKEIWIDISKKAAYRAYPITFSVLNASPSDKITVTVAQSRFNDGVAHLKSVVIGTDIYSKLVEGEKITFEIAPVVGSVLDVSSAP
jgi:hypothetical protein